MFPFENKYAVTFGVTYEHLQARISATTERIVVFLVFALMIGVAFAFAVSSRITNPVEQLAQTAEEFGKGNLQKRIIVHGQDEVAMLGQTFNTMATELEKSTKALVYEERVAKELELAAKIQKEILPKKLPEIPGLDLAASVVPAAEIGGDCYDFIPVTDSSGDYIIYIGDVTGHGVSSGIVVSIANALLYSFSQNGSLKGILENTNRVLKAKTSGNMFMTMLMLQWNPGGEYQLYKRGTSRNASLFRKKQKVVAVPGGGIALGMFPDIGKSLEQKEFAMEIGDCVVLYSDGIPEMIAENGKDMYGLQRFKRALSEYAELSSAAAVQKPFLPMSNCSRAPQNRPTMSPSWFSKESSDSSRCSH